MSRILYLLAIPALSSLPATAVADPGDWYLGGAVVYTDDDPDNSFSPYLVFGAGYLGTRTTSGSEENPPARGLDSNGASAAERSRSGVNRGFTSHGRKTTA